MPKTALTDIAQVLAERSLGRVNTEQLSQQIAAYLLENRRTADLEPLLRDVIEYRAQHGIVEVIAVSARPLNDGARTDIEQQVKALYPAAKTIIISEETDTDIIGGVRLEFPDQQLDLSIRAKLSRFKQLTTAKV